MDTITSLPYDATPYQEGVVHGPYIPDLAESMKDRELGQLKEHSLAIYDAAETKDITVNAARILLSGVIRRGFEITDTSTEETTDSTQQSETESSESKASLKNMTEQELTEWFGAGNIHNGSHFMNETENQEYQRLCESDLKTAIRFLREKWAEHADMDFINGFKRIHWVGSSEFGISKLEQLLSEGNPNVEIATQAYYDQEQLTDNKRWLKAKFGVLIDGNVTLASNEDIQSNQWHGTVEQEGGPTKRVKYTEWANRLMTDESNYVQPYEFIVGDWRATALVIDPDTPDIDKILAVAQKHGLKVIDSQHNDLFRPKQKVDPANMRQPRA